MDNFKAYAEYYNLLNEDKDYAQEVAYIESLIKRFKPDIKAILELGSGTGNHALHFAQKGYQVVGIDRSNEMVELAKQRLDQHPKASSQVEFVNADMRDLKLEKKFDLVLSLFHVMSYQVTNDDLDQAFHTASKHLEKRGLFLFDCWYGPAVLTHKPEVRVKRVENHDILVHRIAEPVMVPNENRVDVHYEIMVQNKGQGATRQTIHEVHNMRYLFLPEIEFMANKHGFAILHASKYLTMEELSDHSWYGCIILEKVR